ncbi:S-adenosylmethionine decarboxylase proenzyme [contains: s-adenosylmethionine decarboxylase alpha chain; s adenosylmethionine decarboxylase beta chain], putative [Candida dubliniensis CD36]|uniref:S-adenosylmethionine decarboxylase proenzyme n=1 Tax=Candida dubliniensis (strain CD36 / ATCC MYA-646 / CBS 7987 / NCPF 3949 / NRRL Y-17841) TaxID=573826 RepID=B9WH11_CANDC|nr:S-adenosylmethionine decarboxylase proenzyme [contains: s-adenosylmethionine decarboxylase alpha chain; s adenosylmethionine decarboxylase beta chain], putative [Candida dubliniensis CD36]CAX41452.1 S-adenosylmethionine decarboxylase proenzyme [contains: s-adenosylmethionine decarboxylase alpha chain; s adenosylmethionine decarboxylase beta chain], putative [Candida dubliniensis CD36]
MVAPALIYSNHELSTAIDSTHAFEGPEKLLEIWFYPSKELSPINLRNIKFDTWIKILNLVHCEVLSKVSSTLCDAFLLSESSLFVFPHKIILKTCGTTTTLACLDLLFETVTKELQKIYSGDEVVVFSSKEIYQIFYSRRSFMFPDRQIHVHGNWQEEVKLLNQYFNNGKSYIVGNNTNWHLYVGGSGKNGKPNGVAPGDAIPAVNDCTLEIIMTQLSLEASQQFYTTRKPGDTAIDENHDLGHDLGQQVLKQTGLNELFKLKEQSPITSNSSPIKEIHDGFAFTPCGFSSNSINESDYYTIHVTPEPGWSYASFETNMIGADYKAIVDKCINVFQPGQFMVTFLTNTDMQRFECCLDNYKVNHREELDVEDYKLYFVEFIRQ